MESEQTFPGTLSFWPCTLQLRLLLGACTYALQGAVTTSRVRDSH